ncbi:hypothetical protein [Proteiniborus sp.]
MQEKEITLWNLIETAGVRLKYIKSISKEIREVLAFKGHSVDFI